MPESIRRSRKVSAQRSVSSWTGLPVLRSAVLLGWGVLSTLGCGGSEPVQQQVAVATADPQGEFEWGMERLDRALRLFRPSGSDGLNITKRTLDSELFPPDDKKLTYTARVTVTTETSFLHGRRKHDQEPEPAVAADKASEIDDPLADKTDEWDEFVDLPGIGPQAPATPSTAIETRSLDTKTVFEMAYVEGHWKLTRQPELEHERLWFEYAFEQ